MVGVGVFVLAIVLAGVWGLVAGGSAVVRHREVAVHREVSAQSTAQSLAEEWATWFLSRYPKLNDEAIATLMRDELINRRMATDANLRWAHPDTVGRVRRTIVRTVLEADG
jgi:hypothetical protein